MTAYSPPSDLKRPRLAIYPGGNRWWLVCDVCQVISGSFTSEVQAKDALAEHLTGWRHGGAQ